MKIKAGKYTLALSMIAAGVLMLANAVSGSGLFADLWIYSPVVLIFFGLEILVLNLISLYITKCEVRVSVGSIFLIVLVVLIFTAYTATIEIDAPFLEYIYYW